eukprot:8399426-Pyramimonas_sp.AAC.1
MSSTCELSDRAASLAVVDAKSVFDTLSKNAAGSRSDRRNAIELAVVRDSLSSTGSQIRWLPHGRMPADPLTHADPSKSNLALHDLLCRGSMCLVDEGGHLDERALNMSLKSRSRGASRRALIEEARRRDEVEEDRPRGSEEEHGSRKKEEAEAEE